MKQLWAVAVNTFRETVRSKFFYALIGFAVLALAASWLAGSVSLGQDVRVVEDFNLTLMLVFLLIITIFIGTQLVHREIDQKTIYLTLTKPISRDTFYLGKYVGLCLMNGLAAVIMGIIFLAVLYFRAHIFPASAVWAIAVMIPEIWLLTAVSVLCSSFTAPLPSAIYTFCLTLIGLSSTTIFVIAQKGPAFLRGVLKTVYYVFPNLDKFNFRNEVVYNFSPDAKQLAFVGLYFIGYTAALLLLGMAIFRQHEF